MNKKQKENSQNRRVYNNLKSGVIRFLGHKPRTSFEVKSFAKKYLEKTDLPEEEHSALIEEVLSLLEESRYVDDLDYAKSYILEQQRRPLPRGPRYIYQFLSKKGLSPNVIRSSLETHFPEEKEKFCIEKILFKKKDTPHKLIQYLLGKGFNSNLVYTLVDTTGENH